MIFLPVTLKNDSVVTTVTHITNVLAKMTRGCEKAL